MPFFKTTKAGSGRLEDYSRDEEVWLSSEAVAIVYPISARACRAVVGGEELLLREPAASLIKRCS
jgi:hypothetical protein